MVASLLYEYPVDYSLKLFEIGHDVARYVVSTQDDGDPVLTFRSFIIGSGKTNQCQSGNDRISNVETGLTALAACINQMFAF